VAAKTPPATRPPVKARAKAAADTASAPRRTAAAESAAPAPTPAPTARNAGGDYWVQVGAFRDPAAARRLAGRLREQGYTVDESLRQATGEAPPASAASMPPAADRYLVFVSGASNDLATQLKARGLTAETAPGGVVVTPSRPLRDAVQLSRDLTADGLKVQVRRAAGAADAGPPASPPTPAASEGGAFHRIRVAGFSDRAAAEAAARELHARGYSPFVGQGAK
jgi:cell division septation protein DedD